MPDAIDASDVAYEEKMQKALNLKRWPEGSK
jgi:hypothetical protein